MKKTLIIAVALLGMSFAGYGQTYASSVLGELGDGFMSVMKKSKAEKEQYDISYYGEEVFEEEGLTAYRLTRSGYHKNIHEDVYIKHGIVISIQIIYEWDQENAKEWKKDDWNETTKQESITFFKKNNVRNPLFNTLYGIPRGYFDDGKTPYWVIDHRGFEVLIYEEKAVSGNELENKLVISFTNESLEKIKNL